MALVQAVAIGLIALIVTPEWLFYFDVTPKLIVLLAIAGVSLAGARPAARSLFSLLILLSVLSLGLSTSLSASPAISAFGTNWRRYGAVTQGAVLLLAWLVSAQAHRVIPILRVLVAAGAVTALYGVAQYSGWDPILPAVAYHIGEGVWTIVRPPSTFGYVSYFATWLLFIVFLSLAIPGRIWKAVAAVAAAAMLLTGTRAAVLGLVAGGAVWLFWRGWRTSRRTVIAAAAVIAITGAFYYSPPGWQLRSRTRWFVEDPWGGARPLLWRDSMRMAGSKLVAGFGPETFTAEFPHYQSAELARAYPDFSHESPHNIFLDALVSQGLPGLLLLAGFCVLGFRAAWRLRIHYPGVAPALAAALAAGIVSQQFTVFTIPTAVIFFTTIALAVGLDTPPAETRARSFVPVLAAIPLLYLAVRFAATDRELALTQQSLAARDLSGAMEHYRSAQIPGASSDLWYSRSLTRAGMLPDAIAAGLRATQTAEDPFNAWYSLAALYAAQNDAGRAEASLRAAIRANPTWFKPRWTLARLLEMTGHTEEGEREASLAVYLDGGKHPDVALTLDQIRTGLQK
jgi:O-antigen ligase